MTSRRFSAALLIATLAAVSAILGPPVFVALSRPAHQLINRSTDQLAKP